jgi:hypothetical protein
MSACGVTLVRENGITENLWLDQWSREVSRFNEIRKLKFLKQSLLGHSSECGNFLCDIGDLRTFKQQSVSNRSFAIRTFLRCISHFRAA